MHSNLNRRTHQHTETWHISHRLSLFTVLQFRGDVQNVSVLFLYVSWLKLFLVFSRTLFCEATCWPTAHEAGISRKCVVTAITSDDSSPWCTQLTKSLKTPADPPDVFVEHRRCRVLSLPYFVLNSIFSVRAFKESGDSAGDPLGKLLVDTERAVWQSFRCISVPQKYVAEIWTNRAVLWCQRRAGRAGSRTGSWRELAGMTLALSHQGLHSNSTIMSLSARCEP